MKKGLLLTLFLVSLVGFGQCPNEEVIFQTQAQIDEFAINYPGCTQIQQGLTISGFEVLDLSPLNILTEVNGTLKIYNNYNLTSLNGLQNISSLNNGDLKIIQNPNLTTISQLSGITGIIDGELRIENNVLLENLAGIENITETIGALAIVVLPSVMNLSELQNFQSCNGLEIAGMDNLTTLEGLENLIEVTNYIGISRNPLLESIAVLQNLQPTNLTYLAITYNDNLDSLEGLNNVESIGWVNISYNNSLINLDGLQGITITGGSSSDIYNNNNLISLNGFISNINDPSFELSIHDNSNLSNLVGVFDENMSDIIVDRLIVRNNSTLTNFLGLEDIKHINILEVEDNISLANFDGLQNISVDDLEVKNNPMLNSMQGLMAYNTTVEVSLENNESLVTLTGLEGVSALNGILIKNCNALQNLDALQNVELNYIGVDLRDNASLESVSGLSGSTFNRLYIRNNDSLLTLNGLEGLTDTAQNIQIRDNEVLVDISALSYITMREFNSFRIQNNPNLSMCSILSVCNDLGDQNMEINDNAPGCNSIAEVAANCNINLNVIKGNAKYDFNLDDCDTGDYNINSLLIEVAKAGGESVITTTSATGDYIAFVEEGTYTTSVLEASIPANFSVLPASVETTFADFGNLEVIDFCFTANDNFSDLKIIVLPLTEARPGFNARYQLVYQNIGNTLLSGEITLEFNYERQTFFNAVPNPDDLNASTITWNYSDLLPFQTRRIFFSLNTLPPPINDSGDILEFQAVINPILDDENPEDNTYNLEQIVVNSFDPNDKQVNQGEEIYESETGNYLDYIVRFQNTGTADAINVRIEDVLSDKLDWNTFRQLTASHNYRIEILDGNNVSFIFDNINLPPEVSDPEGSNGYIAFQIKPVQNIALGDVIENTADIYFDFNAAIVTNTVSTTVVENLGVDGFNLDGMVQLYPNPVSTTFQIKTSNSVLFEKATIYSPLGKRILETSEKQINLENLSAGIYFVEVITNKGSATKKIVKE